MGGNINVNGSTGTANLSIPLHGPRGKGTLYVQAAKATGKWSYSTLILEIEGTGERIDLRQ